MQTTLKNLREVLEKFFQWFSANYLVENADKCRLLTSSKTAIDTQMSRFRMKKESN